MMKYIYQSKKRDFFCRPLKLKNDAAHDPWKCNLSWKEKKDSSVRFDIGKQPTFI